LSSGTSSQPCGARLIPLGQTDGQRLLAALEAPIMRTAERALAVDLDEWGTATLFGGSHDGAPEVFNWQSWKYRFFVRPSPDDA